MAEVFIKIIAALEAQVIPVFQGLESKIFSKSIAKTVAESIPISKHAETLPLMDFFHVLVIIAGYLVMVGAGVLVMKRQEKFNLKAYSLVHNFLMVSLSLYMGLEIIRQAILANYSLFRNKHDQSNIGAAMANIIWVHYFSKILEFNDTAIMILKKNFRQVSFLHVYHHSSVFFIWWITTYWAPNGEAYFSAMLNSFVHVIMYGYYFLSALGFKQVSFIKYYITKTQIFQFLLMMVQATYDIYQHYIYGPTGYPVELSIMQWGYLVSMLGLFANFLIQDQKKKRAPKKDL